MADGYPFVNVDHLLFWCYTATKAKDDIMAI